MKCPGCGTNLDVREPVRIPEDAVTETGTGIIHDRERCLSTSGVARLIEAARMYSSFMGHADSCEWRSSCDVCDCGFNALRAALAALAEVAP